jgi:hypothetical protein
VVAAPADVAAVMFDPQQEPQWIEGVTSVELLDPALTPGARVKRSGSFMGRPFAFQTEVETVHFPHVLAMKIAEGPFIGTIRYDIQRSATGSLVRIRGVGDAPGLPVPSFMITGPARRALAANLERLKTIVEKT